MTHVKTEGSMPLLPIAEVCKTQGQIPTNNKFWYVNTSRPILL